MGTRSQAGRPRWEDEEEEAPETTGGCSGAATDAVEEASGADVSRAEGGTGGEVAGVATEEDDGVDGTSSISTMRSPVQMPSSGTVDAPTEEGAEDGNEALDKGAQRRKTYFSVRHSPVGFDHGLSKQCTTVLDLAIR